MIDDALLVNDWHVVARSSDLGAGQVRAAHLLGRDVVLWREKERQRAGFVAENAPANVHAWRDLCLHRGREAFWWSRDPAGGARSVCYWRDCDARARGGPAADGLSGVPLSRVGVRRFGAVCAHSIAADATAARQSARRNLQGAGQIWLHLGLPGRAARRYSGIFRVVRSCVSQSGCRALRIPRAGPRIIENFLDVGHFPFVHAGLLGDANHTEVGDYEVETRDDGLTAKDIPFFQPDPDGTGWGAEVRYTYRALRPLTAYFVKVNGEKRFAMINFVTPVDESESLSWAIMALNYAPETSDSALREFQDKVAAQDIPIVESQHPELLPLDLQAELHLRSDRTAIAYRQWLRKLGLKYGTA